MKIGERSAQGARTQYVLRGVNEDENDANVACERCANNVFASFVVSECRVVGYPAEFRSCGECMVDFLIIAKMQRARHEAS